MNETETNKQVEVYILTGLLAACSLTYELIVAQSISLLAGNTVVWYAITVGVFLCAMGVGAVICEKITKKSKKHWGQLVYVELLLSTAGALAVPFINSAHMLNGYWFYHSSIWTSILVFFLPS
ncbi:MAG: hypothetical protein KDD56_00590, partial [Bdellovibrionales bacterium]|nr:hypothetical protein [Bdellovibrionales bacterium]